MTILANRIICPDGTILHSRHRHDYVRYVQEDGREYFVDGGTSYIRCGGTDNEYIVDTVTCDDNIERIRETFRWGKWNKEKGEREYILVKDMDTDHIMNVINHIKDRICLSIYDVETEYDLVDVFERELSFRENMENAA